MKNILNQLDKYRKEAEQIVRKNRTPENTEEYFKGRKKKWKFRPKNLVVLIFAFLFLGCVTTQGDPFYRPTKHKPITRMSKKQVHNASVHHKYLYHNGKR